MRDIRLPQKRSFDVPPNYPRLPVTHETVRPAVLPKRPVTPPAPPKRSHRFLWVVAVLLLFGTVLFLAATHVKAVLIDEGERGARATEQAIDYLVIGDFESARRSLKDAEAAFERGNVYIRPLRPLYGWLGRIPGFSRISSGAGLFAAGEEFARAGTLLSRVAEKVLDEKAFSAGSGTSLLALLRSVEADVVMAKTALERGNEAIQTVNVNDVPEDKRDAFLLLRDKLPVIVSLLHGYAEHQRLFEELLGANGPRVYLFLFQNNHELRPTGGFIGSYALLDISNGVVRRFFVDGIFNPDGQLKENIVPPKPIQKISAGWSLHDSNWYPDFPRSAQKAMFFYEKTGGPTTDGVIALTPTVLEHVLEVTGPVDLPEYGVTVDAENFMPIIQEEVEVNYDKEENNPKKILGDLTATLLGRFLSINNQEQFFALSEALSKSLNERHILLYSSHSGIQDIIRKAGWSGEMLPSPHDYLAVIHSNINGYKTDGVIDEEIQHVSEIQSDGTIIDEVRITRTHRGGSTPYDWWNRVNADYLRVYVPRGSELLQAEGMTREFPPSPLDYAALNFRTDPDVVAEEEATEIDEASGTRIAEESGKTVFGNWVYVSPGESVTVRYRYRLPFRLAIEDLTEDAPASFSTLYQKQSGTLGSSLTSEIRYPEGLEPVWQTPENLIPYERVFRSETKLSTDYFVGTVFKPSAP